MNRRKGDEVWQLGFDKVKVENIKNIKWSLQRKLSRKPDYKNCNVALQIC